MKLYYIANARIPTEKAHGIQIAKMCEAFIEAGVDLTLVVPRRQTDSCSVREYYGLRVDVPLVHLPALDWYAGGRVGYLLSSISFMLSYMYFVWDKKRTREEFVLYTVDTDNYSSSALALFDIPLFSEMHGAKLRTPAERFLFRNVRGIIAINQIIVKELQERFPRSHTEYLVEPNGVDLTVFSGKEKQAARTELGLPQEIPIVLYTGRFFEWKGLEILPQAAAQTPSIRWQIVGGDREQFASLVTEPLPENLCFAGSRPHSEMPLWFAAADALVVLGTIRDTQSYRYTSPMKLFEYLAAERSIVASGTPAIHEIVSSKEVSFYEPDNAQDLARIVERVVTHKEETVLQIEAALRLAEKCSWTSRAERIIRFIQAHTSNEHPLLRRSSMISRILKFGISGGISTAISISILYVLTEWAHLWYLMSSVVAFLAGLVVSFTLQKFWTFANPHTTRILRQGMAYAVIQLWNLSLNTVGTYLLVENYGVWYVLAQLIVSGCIAVESFILFHFVFKKEKEESRVERALRT